MYDTFMLIAGIIFIVLTIVAAFLLAVGVMVVQSAVAMYTHANDSLIEANRLREFYEDAIERANDVVVQQFRHDLDHHPENS